MKSLSISVTCAILALAICVLPGCGSGAGTVPVEGTVTYQGTPVAGVNVQFAPVDGGRPSTGTTDSSGRFTLVYTREDQGAAPGKYNVTFDWYPDTEGEEATEAISAVLEKHGVEGSPLEVEITGEVHDLAVSID